MPAFPAARIGDAVTHDLLAPSGVIGTPLAGPCPHGAVVIEGLPAAHVNCTVLCLGTTAAGVVPSPLHTAPVPVVAGVTGGGGPAADSGAAPGEATSPPKSEPATEFTLEVLGGWTGSGSIPIGSIARLPVPEMGMRCDHLVVRIQDPQGNAAVYEYWAESLSGGELAQGKPAKFHTSEPYTIDEFAGKARLNSTQEGGSTYYTFKFGQPKQRDLVWNDDFFRDGFGKMGVAPFAKLREYEAEIEDLDVPDANPQVSRSLFSIDDSEGMMTLKKVIPKPPPPAPAVPVLLPVPSTNPIILGSRTVFVHGMPAARWAPSGDVAACLSMLGDPKLLPTRTVWFG
jgi:hypothetical protein